MGDRRFRSGALGSQYRVPAKKRVKKKSSSERRFKTGSLGSQFKAPAIPATAPPSVPNPPISPPIDFASQYTTGLVGFNALPEIVSRVTNPLLQFLVNRGPQGLQRTLLQRLGPQLGAGAARVADLGIQRGAPLLLLSGLGPQPQPGRYDIPSGGTPQWRAKHPDMARAYDTQRRQDASVRRLRGLANFYATRSSRR